MQSQFQASFRICTANQIQVEGAKNIADANRHIFGFITRSAFYDAFQAGNLIVAVRDEEVIGFLRYHHRKRDLQTTLYDICVADSERGKSIGYGMMRMLIDCCCKSGRTIILLKCPVHLPANTFYERNGFTHIDTVVGKRQNLNVWKLGITERS